MFWAYVILSLSCGIWIPVYVVLTNGAYVLNVDCDHYFNNSKALKEAFMVVKQRKYSILKKTPFYDDSDNDRRRMHLILRRTRGHHRLRMHRILRWACSGARLRIQCILGRSHSHDHRRLRCILRWVCPGVRLRIWCFLARSHWQDCRRLRCILRRACPHARCKIMCFLRWSFPTVVDMVTTFHYVGDDDDR